MSTRGQKMVSSSERFVLGIAGALAGLSIAGCPDPDARPTEGEHVQEAIRLMRRQAEEIQRKSGGEARRAMFAKHHGCVRARLTPVPERPPATRHGIFASDATRDAWLRFSNAAPEPRPDGEGSGRGLAISVLDVDGPRVLESATQDTTQDFLMLNHPVFVVKDVEAHNSLVSRPKEFLAEHPQTAATIAAIRAKQVFDPLEIRYWSITAYELGPHVVKLSAAPCEAARVVAPVSSSEDHLAESMERHLQEREGCFWLMVQLQANPVRMPIDDPTVEWDESLAPFVTVARLEIPMQHFRSPAQDAFCEARRFSPWHSLEAHRPLGSLNEMRRVLYDEMARWRGVNQEH